MSYSPTPDFLIAHVATAAAGNQAANFGVGDHVEWNTAFVHGTRLAISTGGAGQANGIITFVEGGLYRIQWAVQANFNQGAGAIDLTLFNIANAANQQSFDGCTQIASSVFSATFAGVVGQKGAADAVISPSAGDTMDIRITTINTTAPDVYVFYSQLTITAFERPGRPI
jgi:hypothetical protein